MRNLGLSANQVVHVPGAGDFLIDQIEGTDEPAVLGVPAPRVTKGDSAAMDTSGPPGLAVLPDPAVREEVVRENEADPLAGEQTWPTDMVGCHAQLDTPCLKIFRVVSPGLPHSILYEITFILCQLWMVSGRVPSLTIHAHSSKHFPFDWGCSSISRQNRAWCGQELLEAEQQGRKKRKLPKGTSEYQAAWILEDIEGEGESSEEEDDEQNAAAGPANDRDDHRHVLCLSQVAGNEIARCLVQYL